MGHLGRNLFALACCAMLIERSVAEVPSAPQRSRDHSHVGGHATWCALHVVRREYRQAIEDCDEALSQDANDADAYSNRSAAYLMMAEIDRAIVDLEAALRLNPMDATLHYNRALLHFKKGEHAAAVSEYSETIRAEPGSCIRLQQSGRCL